MTDTRNQGVSCTELWNALLCSRKSYWRFFTEVQLHLCRQKDWIILKNCTKTREVRIMNVLQSLIFIFRCSCFQAVSKNPKWLSIGFFCSIRSEPSSFESNVTTDITTDISRTLTLILRRSRKGTVWFYTSTSNKRAARPKLYTKSLTRDLKRMYSRFTLVRISIKL